ncbi:class I SAM-dependent methyltransferase [Accumulibacter sp.]|uniref:class I SAM-dependent methyltransferase n=1 Tax=Accumulibacter sp. TaxID=2053492 RepID=UPI0028C39617|nr:class I SAM-dependent methyltransferase [Accumulibacter sp.]
MPPTQSLKRLARRLPNPIYRVLQRLHQRLAPAAAQLQPKPGPLITELAPRLAAIPGWFNLDDLAHFTLVLGTQAAAGLSGDILEIGCYHGRSAAVLALHLQQGEQLFLVDAFDLPLDEAYGDTPSPQGVWDNLQSVVPGLSRQRVHIQRAYSGDLRLPAECRLRLAHVDGGHDAATARADLELCLRHLLPGGVLVVDDYAHPQHPGVTEAVESLLHEHAGLRVLADLNRSGALGRKLYLSATPAPAPAR